MDFQVFVYYNTLNCTWGPPIDINGILVGYRVSACMVWRGLLLSLLYVCVAFCSIISTCILYMHFNVIASLVSAKFQIYLKSELYLTLTNLNNTLHILDLEPRQNYIVEIAALTSIGEGERSSVIVQTGDSECCSLVTVEHLL